MHSCPRTLEAICFLSCSNVHTFIAAICYQIETQVGFKTGRGSCSPESMPSDFSVDGHTYDVFALFY